ncbi:MAG: LysM domain-containing protein [Anaerolineaceae bacterium]|jgi:LysM repeat protein
MKKFAIAIFTAILIAGQFFTPVAAAAPSAWQPSWQPWQQSQSCGDTYTVHRGDWLSKIARYCGTTLGNILALNPQIYNPNWIYAGMVVRLTGSAEQQGPQWQQPQRPAPPQPRNTRSAYTYQGWGYNNYYQWQGGYYYSYSRPSQYARVSLSTTRAGVGDDVKVYASGFPAKAEIDFRIGRKGKSYDVAYDGKTNSSGAASMTIPIPSDADAGQYWVVRVLTTELDDGVDVYSPEIYITH